MVIWLFYHRCSTLNLPFFDAFARQLPRVFEFLSFIITSLSITILAGLDCTLSAKQQVGLVAPPVYLSKEDIQREEMQEVLPDWSLEPLKVYAIWPANISTSSAAYKLINYIYNAMEQHKL